MLSLLLLWLATHNNKDMAGVKPSLKDMAGVMPSLTDTVEVMPSLMGMDMDMVGGKCPLIL